MTQPRHRIFPVRPERFQLLPPSTLFSSRRSLTPSLLDLMNFGSWNGPKMAEKPGSLLKHFWKTCTSRVTGRHYAPPPTNGASTTTYPSTHPPLLRQHQFPVLPHPEHTNVHVSQPFEAIPDQLHILQSCWGRSAQHHSQGTTTSLSWPPWRSTPPSSPSATLHRTLHSNTPTTPLHHPHRPVPPDEPGPMDMSDSSV